jgi:hypothetical protein
MLFNVVCSTLLLSLEPMLVKIATPECLSGAWHHVAGRAAVRLRFCADAGV